MRRKPLAQRVEKMRGNRDYGFLEIRRQCARWGQDHVEALRDAEPKVPDQLHDRAQDNWEPLLAIADALGGDWPARCRTAALKLHQAAEQQDAAELSVQLIHDIVALMAAEDDGKGVDRITTQLLLLRLHEMEERVWGTYGRTETPMKDHQLATLLRQFDVHSHQMKIEVAGKTVNRRGLERAQFIPLLARYPLESATSLPSAETQGTNADTEALQDDARVGVKAAETLEGSEVAGLFRAVRESG